MVWQIFQAWRCLSTMAKIHTRIAAVILGIAMPVAAAIPASAAITAGDSDRDSRSIERIDRLERMLNLDKGELREKLAKVDTSNLDPAQLKKLNRLSDRAVDESDRIDRKRTAMMRFGAPAADSNAEADLPVPGLPDTSLLTGLLQQILDLVKGLLASLGLSLPDLPVPLPAQASDAEAEGLPGVPGLPDTSVLTGLLKQILDLVKGLLESLGLGLPDLPVPLPASEEDAAGLPGGLDTSFLTDLIDQVLSVVMDLLSGLGLGGSVPDLPVPLPE
ncbi:hypothetical protein [Tenggerimyces flavus]|uniref:Uncharacterized protein n=1 Tax=Tenggerimyces flavus TaxID=1708749 RepID=A0ABV7YB60_9ACTN|nr:hypothetical protein [Tenggerimyces flavus]MBM7787044.1 hypothetical protein [Tenggerimyces flavus]